MRIAIYPGTFDPITNGHLDIIERATRLFDRVIVAVTTNPGKKPHFEVSEREQMIRELTKPLAGVEVESFMGLLVDYATSRGAVALVRGLRAVSDFEFEFQMALVNRKIAAALETVFLMPNEKYTYLNSTIVKEVAAFGGDVSKFVPPEVVSRLQQKMKRA